jgi:hypothetical protein
MNNGFTSAILKELLAHAIKRLTFLALLLIPNISQAKEMTKQFGDWTFYAYGSEYDKHCLIYSQPLRTRGEFTEERTTPYLYLTKRGDREFSLGVEPGYPIDTDKGVNIIINYRPYGLQITLPNYAWTFSSTQDVRLVDEMLKAGKFITVRSHGIDNSVALDYYSMTGFTKALKLLDKCKLKTISGPNYKP